jgi:hypothetical protein
MFCLLWSASIFAVAFVLCCSLPCPRLFDFFQHGSLFRCLARAVHKLYPSLDGFAVGVSNCVDGAELLQATAGAPARAAFFPGVPPRRTLLLPCMRTPLIVSFLRDHVASRFRLVVGSRLFCGFHRACCPLFAFLRRLPTLPGIPHFRLSSSPTYKHNALIPLCLPSTGAQNSRACCFLTRLELL